MKLATLLTEIDRSRGPVTGIDLALRLGIEPGEVAAMLAALRASGQLGVEQAAEQASAACSSAGACSMTCPGPAECALVLDLSVTGLAIRKPVTDVLSGEETLD